MSKNKPLISVIMPVYNCELYIRESIESILNQSYVNFELLIFDDCSTDKTLNIIEGYKDNRIVVFKKDENTGLTASLNMGLRIAKGKYLARMDGDDISFPNRFEKQVAYLENNTHVVLCSTLYKIYNWYMISNQPLIHEEIKVGLLSGCCISHPTVMMRKDVFINNNLKYDETKESGEDYDLWSRLIFLGEFHNIGEVLLYYRTHPQQISNIKKERQLEITSEIKLRMLRKVNPQLPEYFKMDDLGLSKLKKEDYNLISEKIKMLDELLFLNRYKNIYDISLFKNYIRKRKKNVFNTVMNSEEKGLIDVIFLIQANFKSLNKIGFVNLVKMSYKSIFKNYSTL
jgi:glycosyltransferase involved in cell wall biosynthesis